MNLFLLALLLLVVTAIPAQTAIAQDTPPLPPGGVELLDGKALTPFQRGGKAEVRVEPGGVYAATISERAQYVWDVGISGPTQSEIQTDDVLALEFVATGRGMLSPEAFINAVVELAEAPHSKSLDVTVSVGAEPRRFVFPFTSIGSYAPGRAQLSIRFGDYAQELRISEVRLVNYGKTRTLADLPITRLAYPGMEDGAPWRAEALQRIDRIRKADLKVVVVDPAGKPIPDADVKIEMTRHLYRFGTAAAAPRLVEDTPENLKYREVLKSHFNYVTIENHLKWTLWNRDQQTGLKAVEWLNREGFEVRGHCLIWPGWHNDHFFPKEIVAEYRKRKETDPAGAKAYLRQACADRVLSKTRLFAGKVRDWDVINETYANHDVMDELGREVMIEWFKLAREGDPNAVLYLNDYGILEGAGRDQRHIDFFLNDVKFIKDGGGPIGGIGIQGHWGSTLTDPVRMLQILDDYSKVGLPIQITEFDVNIADEQTQALFTRDALITIFSHPSTDAFIKWGFWQNSHWLPKGAMFRSDWSKKPNALVWEEWVMGKWWTRESGKTDGSGTKAVRGFMGDYEITVSAGGKTQTVAAKLGKGGAEVRVVLAK